MLSPATQIPTILIIDDEPYNLHIMVEYLETHNFHVLIAQDGEGGLQRAHYVQPDLILLDVVLPDMDGFELCRQLKASPATQNIPVIFLTILTIPEDKVKAFQVGGVDYIIKPVQWEEVLARVTTHLRIAALMRQLQEANDTLEQRVAERTAELEQQIELLQKTVMEQAQLLEQVNVPFFSDPG